MDGTGAEPVRADLAIIGGRIAAIGAAASRADAARVIDAEGLVVAPGFIDIKTHSDFTLPLNPLAESKIRQGVTTEVIGHCGFSVAPALPGKVAMLRDYLSPSAPWLTFGETSFAHYLDGFPATSTNVVSLVGHNTLRLMAMGMAPRAARRDEIATMSALLEEALAAGAAGLSTGLFTPPGCFAETDEIVALAHVLKRHGAGYFTHLRDEANHVFEALDEAIHIGATAGVHVQVVHIKLSGLDNWGRASQFIGAIEAARQQRRRDRLRPVSLYRRQQSAQEPAAAVGAVGPARRNDRPSRRPRRADARSAPRSPRPASIISAAFPTGTRSASR